MKKSILLYSLAVGSAAFLLQWLEYQYAVRVFSTEIYVAIIALLFTALGALVGHRLTTTTARATFERNVQAIDYLGISKRECEVLELLALGHSNRENAETLFV